VLAEKHTFLSVLTQLTKIEDREIKEHATVLLAGYEASEQEDEYSQYGR
jgi:hypothetical protein